MFLSDDYKIKQAENNDKKDIQKLVFGVLKEYSLNPDPMETDKDLNDISKSYNNNRGSFYVILDSGENIIATTGIYNIDESTCELRKMYLLKEHRGKGIGKFLLEYSIDKAKQLGYTKLILETASVLKEAIGLYKSYGFKEVSEGHLSSRCDQRFFIDL